MHDSQTHGDAGWPTAGGGRIGASPTWADGWYPDPLRRAPLRRWTSGAWTGWLSEGTTVWADPRPVRRGLGPLDLAALRFVDEVFLPELRAGVRLDAAQEAGVRQVLAELTAEATGTVAPAPVAPVTPAAAVPTSAAASSGTAAPGATTALASWTSPAPSPQRAPAPGAAATGPVLPRPAVVRPPSAFSLWWRRVREAVGSSLALHGLAYLGVLLMFVGVFGLVAFAFGDVRPGVRPLAELACAAVPFVAAWWLIGHGAVVVGRSLEVVGALLVPILALTSLLDGFPVPPDPHGGALVVVATTVCLLCAAAGLAWSRRHPDSGVRFAVAPTVWLAAAMVTLGVGRPIPTGDGAAVPSAAQTAAMAVALVATTLAARRRPSAAWAPPAMSAALPGSLVVAVLVALTGVADGWPTVPVAVAGAMLVLQVELLRPRLSAQVADVLAPLTLGLVALALLPGLPVAAVGTGLVVGFVVLIELAARRGGALGAVGLPAAGVVVALLMTLDGSWWGVVAPALATGWTVLRRRRPFAVDAPAVTSGASDAEVSGSTVSAAAVRTLVAQALDGALAVLPVWVVVALALVTRPSVGLTLAVVLVVLATVPARTGAWRRDPTDTYWTRWWVGGLVVVAVGALAVHGAAVSDADRWVAAVALVVVAALVVVGPVRASATVWAAAGALVVAWVLLSSSVLVDAVPWPARAGVLGLAGLLLVVACHVVAGPRVEAADGTGDGSPSGARAALALHLGLAGHTLAALALAAALLRQDPGTSQESALATLALTLGAATLAVLVTAVRHDSDRSPVGSWAARVGALGDLTPWLLASLGVPLTAVPTLRVTHVLDGRSPWWVLVPAVTAVTYAALVRWWAAPRLRTVVRWASSVAALVAVLTGGVVTVDAQAGVWPAVLGWAAVVAVALLQPGRVRTGLARWSAWVAVAPLVGLVIRAGAPDLDDTALVALAAVPVGGSLALAAALGGVRAALAGVLPARPHASPAGQPRGPLPETPAGQQSEPPAAPHAGPEPSESTVMVAPERGRGRWTVAPFVVGVVELVVGTAVAAVAVPAPLGAALVVVAAAFVLALGVGLRLGSCGAVAVVLGWSAALWWSGAALQGRPWLLLTCTAVVLAAAEVLHRRTAARGPWARWDVPMLVAALPVGLSTFALGVPVEPVLTLLGTGTLAIVVAIVLRRRGWTVLAEVVLANGTALVLAGAGASGPGWFALALLAVSATHTALAVHAGPVARPVRQAVGVVAGWSAWGVGVLWVGVSGAQARDLTALLGAIVPLGFALHVRWRPAHPAWSWAVAWGGAGVGVVGLLSGAALLPVADGGARGVQASLALLAAVLLVAVAAALGAVPWRAAGLREVCGAAVLVAVLLALELGGAGAASRVGTLAALAAALAVTASALSARASGHAWFRAATVTGAVASAVGLAVALGSDDVLLLGPVLAAAAVQAGAAGVTLRSWGLQALAPVLACLAWWSLAAGALEAGASAYTIALGVALLADVELWRADLRRRTPVGALRVVIPLELVGVALLVVVPCVQAVTSSVLHAAVVLVLGVLVAGWGALTRVRRRVVTGSLVVLVAVVLLVGVPLVALLPGWGGAAVWVLVAGVGFLAVLAATQLERGRTAVRTTWQRWGQDSSGWE